MTSSVEGHVARKRSRHGDDVVVFLAVSLCYHFPTKYAWRTEVPRARAGATVLSILAHGLWWNAVLEAGANWRTGVKSAAARGFQSGCSACIGVPGFVKLPPATLHFTNLGGYTSIGRDAPAAVEPGGSAAVLSSFMHHLSPFNVL